MEPQANNTFNSMSIEWDTEAVSFRKFRGEPKKYIGKIVKILDGSGSTMFYLCPNLPNTEGTANVTGFNEDDRVNLNLMFDNVEKITNSINL